MKRLLTAALVAGLALAAPSPAHAQGARVTVSPQTADPAYATTVTLKGAGFQSVKNGHGGIYVLFGWVSDPAGGAWKPSKGGAPGTTLRYVQDRESKDNLGYQRFVAFPGGDTSSSANGGVIAEDGAWSAQLNIPGARFKSADRAGKVSDVDCTQTQCGIITIGAHGVVNANIETVVTPASAAQQAVTVTPNADLDPGEAGQKILVTGRPHDHSRCGMRCASAEPGRRGDRAACDTG